MASREGLEFTGRFRLPRRLVERRQYLLDAARGKRVLHVGCVDFAENGDLAATVSNPRWLHRALTGEAAQVVGVDLAREAIEALRAEHGVDNVFYGDAERLDALDMGRFDLVVAGEVLEHLPNPGRFLASARSVLKPAGEVVVTTANAYCLRRLIRVATGSESVHPEHVAYYSHRTLSRLAEMHGYEVVEQLAYRLPNRQPVVPYLLERAAALISPDLCEGVIVRMRVLDEH